MRALNKNASNAFVWNIRSRSFFFSSLCSVTCEQRTVVLWFFFWGTKTRDAFIHSLVLQNNRARAFACVHLPRIENNTSHSDRPTREEELSCHFYPFARENKRFWRACFSFSLSFCGQHPSAVKKEAARISNKKSPPRKTTLFFLLC